MQFDLGIIRTVVNSDITEDMHTKHEFREANINFTVLTHHIPDPNKKLVPFDPEAFETPDTNGQIPQIPASGE